VPKLIAIPYAARDSGIPYTAFPPGAAKASQANASSSGDVLSRCAKYVFPNDSSFVPDKLEIRGINDAGRDRDPARLCVLGKDRLHYKVFVIPDTRLGLARAGEDVLMV